MAEHPEDWIAAARLRAVDDASTIAIDSQTLADPRLSLTAKGLYALLLSHQGAPIDPYNGHFEDVADIRGAVDELLVAGLAVRIETRGDYG